MKDKYMWIVRYNNRAIDRVDPINYNPDILEWTLDSAFDTFPQAQNHLLNILKAEHAQAVADISRLSIELTAIEAKIRIVNTSTEEDYT